jgi:hypothetical protein
VADFENLDALLSSSLKSAAEPANSAGVADLIRSRVAAGDAGTSVAGSTAPGWGGGASGLLTIVAPIALIVVAGVTGGALGASGLLGTTDGPVSGDVPAYVITPDTATAHTCPGGPETTVLLANTRVLAVARDADSQWLGVRDPNEVSTVIWFPVGEVVVDEGSPDPATLPVMACPEATVVVVEPDPVPTQEPTTPPTDNPNPPSPPKDTANPVVTSIKASKTSVINGESSEISVAASDNVGVAGIQLSWSNGSVSGNVSMPKNGSSWAYTWSNQSFANNTFGNYTFTARAVDAAGNLSAPVQVVVNRQYLG